MAIWAAVIGATVAAVWLLSWAVQFAAYAMLALAWIGWAGLRLAAAAACLAGFAVAALFGTPPMKSYARAVLAHGSLGGVMRLA